MTQGSHNTRVREEAVVANIPASPELLAKIANPIHAMPSSGERLNLFITLL